MRSPTRRAGAAALVALCTGVLFAACSSGSGSGSRSTTTSTTKAKVTPRPRPPPLDHAPVTTTTAVAQASTCQPSQLTMTPGQSNGAAAHRPRDHMVNRVHLHDAGLSRHAAALEWGRHCHQRDPRRELRQRVGDAPAVLVTLHTGRTPRSRSPMRTCPWQRDDVPHLTSAEITRQRSATQVIALAIAPCGGARSTCRPSTPAPEADPDGVYLARVTRRRVRGVALAASRQRRRSRITSPLGAEKRRCLLLLGREPAGDGADVVVRTRRGEQPSQVSATGASVRSRVHEYGGGAYALVRRDGATCLVESTSTTSASTWSTRPPGGAGRSGARRPRARSGATATCR